MRRSARRRDDVRTIGAAPSGRRALPAVAVILQVASEGPLVDTFLDGEPLGAVRSVVIDRRRRCTEAAHERRLRLAGRAQRHGRLPGPGARSASSASATARRCGSPGSILAPGYLDGAEQKRRAAEAWAALVAELGADGVVCTTFS